MSLNIAQQFMKEMVKKLFWSIKNSGEILSKHVFNMFGVMYVILMLHAYVTILRGLTGLILWRNSHVQ